MLVTPGELVLLVLDARRLRHDGLSAAPALS